MFDFNDLLGKVVDTAGGVLVAKEEAKNPPPAQSAAPKIPEPAPALPEPTKPAAETNLKVIATIGVVSLLAGILGATILARKGK